MIQIKLLIENKLIFGEVSSLVVNKMADSVTTAPPDKSGIRLKNPGSGSNLSLEILYMIQILS